MPTTSYLPNARGLETYRTASSTNVGQLFTKYVDLAVEEEDLFASLEGKEGSDMPIWVKTDLSKTGGGADRVYFNSVAALGGDGVHGDEVLEGNEEQLEISNYFCQVDFVRHAVALTKKDIKFLAAGGSLEAAAAPLVSKWLGRKRQRDMLMRFISSAVGLNTIRPNTAATRDDLQSTDTLSTSVITQARAVAESRGAEPINIMKDGKSKVYEYMFLATEDGLNSLANSSSWLQAQNYAGERGEGNVIFKGGFTRWNGQTIVHHKVIDMDTRGPIGSPLLPKALLGTAISAGTTAIDITGGGRTSPATDKKFFECFSGSPYRYLESDSTTSSDSATYYVVIINVSGSDKGKWGFYSYVGTDVDGNKITITNRLGSAASGARVTTLGNVTWNSSINTDAHPTGSVILQANAYGFPIGYAIALGKGAGLRAYGDIRHELVDTERDYKFRKGWAYESVYGQTVRKDTDGNPRHYVLIEHVTYPANAPMKLS